MLRSLIDKLRVKDINAPSDLEGAIDQVIKYYEERYKVLGFQILDKGSEYWIVLSIDYE